MSQIIDDSPLGTHISLEYFTHPFPQSSIIARFEPKIRNFSHPLTIIGAHQDSANYLFPLLPAPGADDDCSGTVSILEAFRILAESGYTPKNGPVEFHWYAAEEGGLLGSQAIARYPFRCRQVRVGSCASKRTKLANHIARFFGLRPLICCKFEVYLITETRTWRQRNG